MASVVAARDEKEKERRDASVNLRARPRASSVLPRAPSEPSSLLKSSCFKIKSRLWLAVGQAVGISRQISQLAPLCGPSQDRRTQSANGKRLRTNLPARWFGAPDGLVLCKFGCFGSCFGARCFLPAICPKKRSPSAAPTTAWDTEVRFVALHARQASAP